MKTNSKEMIAALVKEGRIAKGFTQKELAQLSNISIRSIQRIENGELMPRTYTIKTLAGILEKPYEEFSKFLQEDLVASKSDSQLHKSVTNNSYGINKTQRIILSTAICIAILLLAWAFVAQSSKFPETTFELLLFTIVILLLITTAMFLVWRDKRN